MMLRSLFLNSSGPGIRIGLNKRTYTKIFKFLICTEIFACCKPDYMKKNYSRKFRVNVSFQKDKRKILIHAVSINFFKIFLQKIFII